jgi:hypothetical protein
MRIPYNVSDPTETTNNPIAAAKQLRVDRPIGPKSFSLPDVAKITRESRLIEPAFRSIFLFEHDLFGKPVSTFPDPVSGSVRLNPLFRRSSE